MFALGSPPMFVHLSVYLADTLILGEQDGLQSAVMYFSSCMLDLLLYFVYWG